MLHGSSNPECKRIFKDIIFTFGPQSYKVGDEYALVSENAVLFSVEDPICAVCMCVPQVEGCV